ncbi:MAG: hypothetical protein IJ433_08480 [Ruminococcus sp.]|nr:hypothetical protein [Ruminococcus sp.]
MYKRILSVITSICIALCATVSINAESSQASKTDTAESLVSSYFNTVTEFNGNYYALYYGIGYLDWYDVKDLCESMGGHLATITSSKEQEFIQSTILKSDNGYGAYFIGGEKVDNKWQWITGEEWDYTAWEVNTNQPDNEGGKQDKLRIVYAPNDSWNLGWDDIGYAQMPTQQVPNGFICEWEDEITIEPYIDNNHYYYAVNAEITWEDAKKYCEILGGHLATVTDVVEERAIEKTATHFHEYYLGGTDANEESEWEWVTGEDWYYTNWEKGKPDNKTRFLDKYNQPKGEDYLVYRNFFDFKISVKKWDDCVANLTDYTDYDNLVGFVCEWDEMPVNPYIIVLGDVDLDGTITIMDTSEVQRYLASYVTFDSKKLKRSDTTRDDYVSIMDATAIQRYLARQIYRF